MTVAAVRKLVSKARRVKALPAVPLDETSPASRRFKLLTMEDLRAMPPQRWRIRSVLPQQGFAAVFGPSGSAKSFLVLNMIAAVAQGVDWFGYATKQARVIYIVLEGQAGIPQRIQAWEADAGKDFPAGVKFIFEPFKLTDREHLLGLAASIEAAGGAELVVVDTYNRAVPGIDENSSQDTSEALEAAKELQAMTGSLVVLVHHTGKDAAKGMRGHSSMHAALDAVIEVGRTDDRREWKVHKLKDGEDGAAHAFRLKVVDLGKDEDGHSVSSCVVIDATGESSAAPMRVKVPKGGNQRIVYDGLGTLLRESSAFGRGGAPLSRPCILLDDAIAGTHGRLAVEHKRQGERCRQAITGLIATGVLGSNEGWLWLK